MCYLAGHGFMVNLKETKTVAWELHPLGRPVYLWSDCTVTLSQNSRWEARKRRALSVWMSASPISSFSLVKFHPQDHLAPSSTHTSPSASCSELRSHPRKCGVAFKSGGGERKQGFGVCIWSDWWALGSWPPMCKQSWMAVAVSEQVAEGRKNLKWGKGLTFISCFLSACFTRPQMPEMLQKIKFSLCWWIFPHSQG